MRSKIVRGAICAAMLLGLPLAGAATLQSDIGIYLQFPPVTQHVTHAPFSALAFGVLAVVDILMLLALAMLLKKSAKKQRVWPNRARRTFPFWGWIGILVMLTGWVLAWTRFTWFQAWQEHTFCVPWLGYILMVNAYCRQRSGRSLMTDAPLKFIILFPASAGFWWFFEYLNRFVQNWYYVNVGEFSPIQYTLLASLAFSTVLPAVLSTHRLLLTFAVFDPGLSAVRPVPLPRGRFPSALALALAGAGLAMIGVYPDLLYPLVWFAPLMIISSLESFWGLPTLFSDLRCGDWRSLAAAAVAALICGIFWEMWNFYSLSRWEYAIPFVDRFHIFAMPLLGYGGYPPFGLECLAIGRLILSPRLLSSS